MKLVVLYGRPATGKLTVARELAALTGWRLFHNHLVVDALLAVFDFGSAPFIELREQIWNDVFARASAAGVPTLIFTFNPEDTVHQSFIDRLVSDAQARGDTVHFIEIVCAESEIERRIDAESRRSTKKLTSLEFYRQLARAGTFDRPLMPAPALQVDTGTLAPAEAAARIRDFLA